VTRPARLIEQIRGADARIRLHAPAPKRGILRPAVLTLFSDYPLGLFSAVCRLPVDFQCLVYPRPLAGKSALRREASEGTDRQSGVSPGTEDFNALRPYTPGDLPQHISWKASSRGQGLFTKVFSGTTGKAVVIDWNACEEPDRERRLSLMCHWVLEARRQEMRFGLKLPGSGLPADSGEGQARRCLEMLALFQHEER
jgi:uncharacterized protein (DUF58 family)